MIVSLRGAMKILKKHKVGVEDFTQSPPRGKKNLKIIGNYFKMPQIHRLRDMK